MISREERSSTIKNKKRKGGRESTAIIISDARIDHFVWHATVRTRGIVDALMRELGAFRNVYICRETRKAYT